MKTIIAGSRDINDLALIEKALDDCGWLPTVVVSGTARGVDQLGERWANERGIPIERYPADWETFGTAAGCIRNNKMAEVSEACVLVWDGKSTGTRHMMRAARRMGLRLHVHIVRLAKPPDGEQSRETP